MTLGRDFVEASTTGITLYGYYSQTIRALCPDLFIGGNQSLFNDPLQVVADFFPSHPLPSWSPLQCPPAPSSCSPGPAFVHSALPGFVDNYFLFFNLNGEFPDALFAQFDLQGLKFNLLGKGIIFPVVSYIILLILIFLDELLGIGNLLFLSVDGLFQTCNVFIVFGNPGL